MSTDKLSPAVQDLASALELNAGVVTLPNEAATRFGGLAHDDKRAVAEDLTVLIARLMSQGQGTAPAVASLSLLAAPLLR